MQKYEKLEKIGEGNDFISSVYSKLNLKLPVNSCWLQRTIG